MAQTVGAKSSVCLSAASSVTLAHRGTRQPMRLLGCRASRGDIAVCLMTASVAGLDVVYQAGSSSSSSPSSGAAAAAEVFSTTAEGATTTGDARGERAKERADAATISPSSPRAPTPCGKKGGGGVGAGGVSTPATDSDTCVLVTGEGNIHSPYAICLYLASQAKTEEARGILLPSEEQTATQPNKEQKQHGNCLGDTQQILDAKKKRLWLVQDSLAWAAFTLRGAVRGVRKDLLLQQLDSLQQQLENSSPAFVGLSLPAMFVFAALRYNFPTSTFSDWPAVSKWLTVLSSSPVVAAISLLIPLPSFAPYPQIRRATLLYPTSGRSHKEDDVQQQKRKGDASTLERTEATDTPTAAQKEGGSPQQVSSAGKDVRGRSSALGELNGLDCSGKETSSPEIPRNIKREKYYITTAINYTNGSPHMGHVYEAVAADVIARYHRVFGRDVYFLTGTDEHGQKIANTAARMGKQPQDICDMYVEQFQALNERLSISNDFYIRTTMPAHKKVCQWLWERVKANGDIYLDTYRGWYNEREETFVSEQDAKTAEYKDPVTGKPLQRMEEASYFFRMSKYQTRLIEHIRQNPNFILPEERRRHILKRLEEPLLDLSCSRNTFSWGVPVPSDPAHVMYVWFDALTNYISALDPPDGEKYKRYWPADLHLIGKDILWFHTVIWPCMLMSASLPLPKTMFGHGFVLAADGEKMSKSLGNVVDPLDILKEHDSDSFRFYLMRAARFGCDLRFEAEGLTACTNADLADTLGNLVHRALSLCVRVCDGVVPDVPLPGATGSPPFNIPEVIAEMETFMKQLMLREAAEVAMEACRSANKYLTDWAPWSLTNIVEKQQVVRGALEAVYVLAHLLEPFIPLAAAQIFEKLNTHRKTLILLSPWFDNLTPGTRVHVGEVLFAKKVTKNAEIAFQKCEVRLGRIVKAQPHPQCSTSPSFPPYMVLTITFTPQRAGADTQQKTAVVLLDREVMQNPQLLLNRHVLAVCNVKATSVKGVVSQVMVLAGVKNGSKPGDAAAEAELLRVAGVDEDGKDLHKREGTPLTSETAESRNAAVNAHESLGALVEAAGHPAVLKNRENVRTAEMQAMDFVVQKDGSVVLDNKFPLRIGQNGAAVRCGRHTPTGKLVLV